MPPRPASITLVLVIIVCALPVVSAVQLPVSASYERFTVTILSYQIGSDEQHAVVYATVRSDYPVTIRIRSAWGAVQSDSGTQLGRGDVKAPLDLIPRTAVPVEAYLISYYSSEQLASMNIRALRLYAAIDYCIPWQFAFWSGCADNPFPYPPDPYVIDRTLTAQEILTIAQQYGVDV